MNYSFIIPHKDSPILLKRCIDSIPKREDLEIIVIDDNSDKSKRPKIFRDDVKIIHLTAKMSNGAGKARNIGLKIARGKWIVFSDADDYFAPNFLECLDKYLTKNVDIVYHPALAVDSETLTPLPSLLSSHNLLFEEYARNSDVLDQVKYKLHSPWWKMVRRSFIEKYDLRFEEIPKGNDIFFSYQIGFFARDIAIDQTPIYVHTFNKNGITYGTKNLAIRVSNLIQRYRINQFYEFVGHKEWKQSVLKLFYEICRDDNKNLLFVTLIYFIFNCLSIRNQRGYYVEKIKEIQNKIL